MARSRVDGLQLPPPFGVLCVAQCGEDSGEVGRLLHPAFEKHLHSIPQPARSAAPGSARRLAAAVRSACRPEPSRPACMRLVRARLQSIFFVPRVSRAGDVHDYAPLCMRATSGLQLALAATRHRPARHPASFFASASNGAVGSSVHTRLQWPRAPQHQRVTDHRRLRRGAADRGQLMLAFA